MPGFVVVLFWMWFALSLAILAYRLVTTGTIRSGGKKAKPVAGEDMVAARQADFDAELAALTGADAEPPKLDGPPTATATDLGELDFETALAAAIEQGPPADLIDADAKTETETETETETDADTDTDTDTDTEGADAVAHDEPVPTGPVTTEPVTTEPDPDAVAARSLAEALEGIQMPADLAPIPGEPFDPRRMLFSTQTVAPASVGGMLADELERLGYALTPLDDRSIAAVGPTACVEVRILPDTELGLEGMLAGRVTPGTVVTEFQLV